MSLAPKVSIQNNMNRASRQSEAKSKTTTDRGQQTLQTLLTLEAEMRAQMTVPALSIWMVNETR